MTIKEAISNADNLRPNTLSEELKAYWLMDLDGQLADQLGLSISDREWPSVDYELLMQAPYEEIYQLYLICRIDYYNMETDMYANDSAIYQATLDEALSWWRRHHMPKQTVVGFKVM